MYTKIPSLLVLGLLTSKAAAAADTTITNVVTITASAAAAPTTSASAQYTDPATFEAAVLNSTNVYRFQHNATGLTYNETLATYAKNYSGQCMWGHSVSSKKPKKNSLRFSCIHTNIPSSTVRMARISLKDSAL